jgi:hypothetical protein
MISLCLSLKEGKYLIVSKPACIITKLHPDIKSASSEKLALLNFLVEAGES